MNRKNSQSIPSSVVNKAIDSALTSFIGQKLYIGLSGGVDSAVLLHALVSTMSSQTQVYAIHVNHQLHDESAQLEQSACDQAEGLHVPIHVERVSIVKKPRTSIEHLARLKRYHIFEKMCPEKALLLLAHHQQDQSETFLLHAFRGGNISSLASMRAIREHAHFSLLRPFLKLSKDILIAYAIEHKLHWHEDPSNKDIDLDRNFLRQEILPLLRQRFPSIDQSLSSSIEACQQASDFHIAIASQWLAQRTTTGTLPIDQLLQQSPLIRSIIVEIWLGDSFRSQSKRFKQSLLEAISKNHHGRYRAFHCKHHDLSIFLWENMLVPFKRQWIKSSPVSYSNSAGFESTNLAENPSIHKSERKKLWNAFKQQKVMPWCRQTTPFLLNSDNQIVQVGSMIFAESAQSSVAHNFDIICLAPR